MLFAEVIIIQCKGFAREARRTYFGDFQHLTKEIQRQYEGKSAREARWFFLKYQGVSQREYSWRSAREARRKSNSPIKSLIN